MLVELFVIGGAVGGVFGFYGRLKGEFNPTHRPLGKLVCFKGIVILLFLQDIIFGSLNSKLFKPTATVTFDDLYFGMPLLLTAIEATIVSITFHWAFSSHLYHEDSFPGQRRMSVWRALFDAMNLSDVVRSTFRACGLLLNSNSGALKLRSSQSRTASRQHRAQLDNMGLEPLTQQHYGHSYNTPEVDGDYQPPGYLPSSSLPTRRYSSGAPPGFQQEQADGLVGRAKHSYSSIGGRDPSPGPDYNNPITPRDVI